MTEINIPRNGSGGGMPDISKLQKWIIPAAILIFVFSSLSSLFYTVNPEEVGVVQLFGKYVRTTNPGLHFKMPWGIETVKKVKVSYNFKEEFGFRTKKAGVQTEYYDSRDYNTRGSFEFNRLRSYMNKAGLSADDIFLSESLMLTGDLNCADVEWVVQYRIKDPVAYSFNVRNINETIRNMSEVVMRQTVGDATVDEVITYGKDLIEKQTKEKLQTILDKLNSGIHIENVVLQDVNPPSQVKASFNEVNEARQDKEKFINQAWEDYNRIIPKAEGEASKKVQEAEGYALQRVNSAKGEAERFIETWNEYKKAEDVTRRRMYLETMSDVLPQVQKKIIMDPEINGVLPFLDLSDGKKGVQNEK